MVTGLPSLWGVVAPRAKLVLLSRRREWPAVLGAGLVRRPVRAARAKTGARPRIREKQSLRAVERSAADRTSVVGSKGTGLALFLR